MTRQDVRLSDRYDLTKSPVLLNGTQALVRLMLMQAAVDRAAGLKTAGLVTGYRGSPLGAVDMQMARAGSALGEAEITFQPGLNEDLAATALWGAQQAELRGEGRYDGVFGLWYGKGPGVDRSGDVMRHANMAGTSVNGGVLMAMGDDHTGESSTVLHQSEWALMDAYMPVVSPAGVQEILDYGLYGYALSRYAGVWVGLKTMKDTVEATSVVEADPAGVSFVTPDLDLPEGGLNIRLVDTPHAQEERIIQWKRVAAEAFSHANKMDKRVWGKPGAKIGLVAAGKNWLDLQHALTLLGIDAERAEALGITTYKVGQTWPLDMRGFQDWAEGLDLIVVVEEKRKLIEVQIKEALFDRRHGRRVYGGVKGETGQPLFGVAGALDPMEIAQKLGLVLQEEGRDSEGLQAALAKLNEAERGKNTEELAARLPYFCSGCPHNSSTKLPEGSRAYAGIGCHYMVQWMDRDTVGFTHMGGEGANWIGEAPFSTRGHVFQNIGDGTYNHSGIQAIRAAVAAGTSVTYKLLFNDAVAMTGGQENDGGLGADRITAELMAMGIRDIALVYDPKEEIDRSLFPKGLEWAPRDQLMEVQKRFAEIQGVSAIVYVQTCAAEKRRRRKRGTFPDPDQRVFINSDVCEGCGDCGVQSNCVSIVPKETALGRKRAIDQSSCNKDFSCLNGFCPSFVTVTGGTPRKEAAAEIALPDLPQPEVPGIDGTYNVVITGIGGTGVVTIGAVLSMAAHLDAKGAGMIEMAGLAQKGGAVQIHCRLAERPQDISAIRVAVGEADLVLGGDLVVTAGRQTLSLMTTGVTHAVVNAHQTITGEFTRDADFRLPVNGLQVSLQARLKDGLLMFDASDVARAALGDSIYSNMMLLGAAWQRGHLPLSEEAIRQAVTLNGAAVDMNLRAFDLGRALVVDPELLTRFAETPLPEDARDPVDLRAEHLTAYQSKRLARKYRAMVARFEGPLRDAVAEGYHKVLAYKDEYEVARLHGATADQVAAAFEGDVRLSYHLAPPLLTGTGPDGRPKKRKFGPWVGRLFGVLAGMKWLRGTPFDVFGYAAERRHERALIKTYEADLAQLLAAPDLTGADAALEIARLPLEIKGFGPVKEANRQAALARRAQLWSGAPDVPVLQAAE